MNYFLPLVILLAAVLPSCQQSSQQTTLSPVASTTVTTPVTSTTAAVVTLDTLLWVGYTANDTQVDMSRFAQPRQVGTMTDPGLVESSGLSPSRQNPGYLWTEEDSGNPNEIQLLSQAGNVVARFTIDGTANRDWEDMAVGPGPMAGETYIYLADIGDNKLRYPEQVIYRFPEPSIAGQTLPYTAHVTNAEAIRLTLPDGPQNAEAILIDPATKDLFMLSKGDRSELYSAAYPQSLTQPTLMTRLLGIPFDKVTSAGISPDNREILIRTYSQLFYYPRLSGESVVDALKRTPKKTTPGQ